MSEANKIQIGGLHYRSTYQHWDFVLDVLGNRYFEGQVTKYVSRWRAKGGLNDLEKAQHFLLKLQEAYHDGRSGPYQRSGIREAACVARYIAENHIPPIEARIIKRVATWYDATELREAGTLLCKLIEDEKLRLAKIEAIKAGAAEPTTGYVDQDRGG